jgi:hypothetical protein
VIHGHTEFEISVRRIPNQEVIDAARENSDMMVAFCQHRPAKGKMVRASARRLIEEGGIRFSSIPPARASPMTGWPTSLRGDRRGQTTGDLSQRAFGHRHRHAGRRGSLKFSNPMHVDGQRTFPT